jgi:LacI family transcriptional regulator
MKDIAKRANVSVVTVSRAFNNKPDISKETKEHILNIAEKLNYSPNVLAQSLVTKDTRTIGVIVPNVSDPFYSRIIDGISNEVSASGYNMDLCSSHEDSEEELVLIKLLRGKQVSGMIINPIQEDKRYIHELNNSPLPFIFVNRYSEEIKNDYVMNDNQYGSYLVIDHLIKIGRKNIIYFCVRPNVSVGEKRIDGCRKAVRDNGLPDSALRVISCDRSIGSCYKMVKELISNNDKMDALYLWDDLLAVGAIRAIYESNLKIPDDIALVGYDDIEVAEYLYPPLTTVRQPTIQIGQMAARILIEKLESEIETESKQIVLKPELVIRNTT